ncbi:MAG: CARDB domain-containing protein [Solirubrobacterales bacterium]
MRRLAVIPLLAAFAAAVPGAAAAVPPSAVSTAVDECVPVSPTTAGSATFRIRMAAVPGTVRVAVRFDLQLRAPGSSIYQMVDGATSGWVRSDPKLPVDLFVWRQAFTPLREPGDYRARVRFRWLDANGKTIAGTTRRTPVCSQPDTRPNLKLTSFTAEPASADGQWRYLLGVRNTGRSDAPPFDISFSVGGEPRPLIMAAGIPAGRAVTLSFTGDRCRPGDAVRVEADPADRIGEVDEADNVLSTTCPAPSQR